MVLRKNNYQFNGQHFLQLIGTGMGTKAAGAYAKNIIRKFEDKCVYTFYTQSFIYLRFIDDIFIIWTEGLTKLPCH